VLVPSVVGAVVNLIEGVLGCSVVCTMPCVVVGNFVLSVVTDVEDIAILVGGFAEN
jgi:hypothetical protein